VLATAPTGRSAAAASPRRIDGIHGIDADDMHAALLAQVDAQLSAERDQGVIDVLRATGRPPSRTTSGAAAPDQGGTTR
jgi:hypothetical protein